MDTGIGFPCPFRNVVIDYFSPTPFIYNEKPNFNVLFVQSTTPWRRFLWIRHPMSWIIIIYLARNNGTKMLSHHVGMRQHFFPLDTDLYPKFALLGKMFSPTGDRSVTKIYMSGEMLSHPNVSHPPGWDNFFAPSFRATYTMTSWSYQEHDVTIESSVMALCFVQLKRR